MPSVATQYLESGASPEINAVYRYIKSCGMTDDAKETGYNLLAGIDRKLNGKPSREFTPAELEYQLSDYKAKIKTLKLGDIELARLADLIVWRLQPVGAAATKQELFTENNDVLKAQQPAAAVAEAPAGQPAPLNLKQFIIPGIMVGAFILWKMGAFDGIMKKIGIGQPVEDDYPFGDGAGDDDGEYDGECGDEPVQD